MVTISAVRESNELIKTALPPGIVAVFIGATSGIGRATLLRFAKYARQPRIYFVGRSEEAADRFTDQLRDMNPDGEYIFIKADVSLLHGVDKVCEQIKEREQSISILFQSQGTLDFYSETSEKLSLILALTYYSRMRFIVNLLPLLQLSPSISRVVSVMAATKEKQMDPNDIPGNKISPWRARGHLASMMTLSMECLADRAHQVSFIHDYPGFVHTGLADTMKGLFGVIMRVLLPIIRLFMSKEYIPIEESGERHVFLATSPKYPAKEETESQSQDSTAMADRVETAVGSDGRVGSGVYTVGALGESADETVLRVLDDLRQEGMKEKIWQNLQDEFERITGKISV
ncbi:hypothetical protein MPDQ_002369 [Monascus purpureus]|uniref:Uncharacterized protein n=2 Tax=Monascus TaxID=5097 RepID=A0A507QPQ8_MONPU|nr:short-chain dehydrogenase/reductase GME3457 [Monascus ruber]TQB69074.1 hypothetical protein MPDQ_002369 [Monascus purpureus]BDD60380.1 hypothetical protein MAP00_005507 [Monascus purpureus]